MSDLLLDEKQRNEVYDNIPTKATCGDERKAFVKAEALHIVPKIRERLEKVFGCFAPEGDLICIYSDDADWCKLFDDILKELKEAK